MSNWTYVDVPVATVTPVADFDASPLTGAHPQMVNVWIGMSPTAYVYSIRIDWGDGGHTYDYSPFGLSYYHTYTAAGTYDVDLVVTMDDGYVLTVSKDNLITIT